MKTILRKLTLGVSLVGIGIGGGAILLAPSPGFTGSDVEHVTEERTCISGCDTETEICCAVEEE